MIQCTIALYIFCQFVRIPFLAYDTTYFSFIAFFSASSKLKKLKYW